MTSHFSMLPKFTNLMSDQLFYKELMNSDCLINEDCKEVDDNLDLNELEEVFSDHMLLRKRLQRSLYGGNLEDIDESTIHPPMALSGLALELFTKAVPNYGLDQLDMDYVSSVSGSTKVSPCAIILAMIYLERLQIKNSDYLESVSPSGLFVVTMLAASKFLFETEDDIVTNRIWSEALNMDVKELTALERKFLAAIDWELYVSSSEFFQQLSSIEKMTAIKQSSVRGWLSYSDICSILQDVFIRKALLISIEMALKVLAVSTLSYAVSVLSIYTVGYIIGSRCDQNTTSVIEGTQLETDMILVVISSEDSHGRQRQVAKFATDETFYHNSISSNLNSIGNTDLKVMESESVTGSNNIVFLNLKNSITSFFGNLLFLSQEIQSANISLNHQISPFDSVINKKNLEWWPFSSKNACIPVLVR